MSTSAPQNTYHYLDFNGALKKMGDLPALNDLLEMLQVSLSRDIPRIQELLAQDDILLVNRILHSLKGFIPIFCSEALCAEVASVEELSRTASAAEVLSAYASLGPKLQLLQQDVARSLSAGGTLFETGSTG